MRSPARDGAGLLVRACAVTGFVASIAVAPALPAHAATEIVYQAQTAATGVHLTLTQQPASSIITASLVDDATAYTAAAFDSSGGSEAQAASVFPGKLVVQGPALFCSEVFTCPATPPDYPLLADASYPRRTHAQAAGNQQPVGSGPVVVTPATASASAVDAGNEGTTSASHISLMSGTPAAINVGASRSATRVDHTTAGLVVHVESIVSDVDIAGLVHIDTIRSVDDITLPARGKPVDRPHVTVSGATVAGVDAHIDDTGVHVAGQNGPSLAHRIAQQGVDIRTVGVTRQDTTSVARSQATGLTVTFSVPVAGVPYVPNPLPSPFDQVPGVDANGTYLGYVTLGAVGAVAGANAQPTFALGGAFPLSTPPAASGAAPAIPAGGNQLLGAPAAVAPVQAPPQSGPLRFFRGVLDGVTVDLADLYAVIALGTVAMFIGWRATVALRRTRPIPGRRG